MSRLPFNGQALLDLRIGSGTVPDLPILVSLVGKLGFDNLTLQANAGESYDWRLIAGLDIEVFASTQVPFSSLLSMLVDLAAAVPQTMVLTFVEGPRVDCGEMRVLQDFALFDWLPMAVGPNAWAESRKLASRLFAELGHGIPVSYDRAVELVEQVARENASCA